ncbi:uncharacterized protein MONOS_18669 [Monocercomonoides exilis]|uniref:uncharacterized protein n=1 Tax=Monocercomonoides exilis TaxID=2049356 RepID=UPI0035595A24|nr:hypothetical protein MONOS_18669 [Monocercomonoides exilis]
MQMEKYMTHCTKMFKKLFEELEGCDEEQKRKIKEMNETIDGMNKEEFKSILTEEIFNKISKMIEDKKMSMENAILLLKHIGYCKALENVYVLCFERSSLYKRFKEMIIEEEKKKEEKNEMFLADLCECYISLSYDYPPEFLYICVTCLLKVALKKEGDEEAQKEAEIALLALSKAGYYEIRQELFLKEIKEIIKCHQENHNLTRLAYLSAWDFLFFRLSNERSLEEVITKELHFAREARRELEELMKCMDWTRKEDRGKEAKDILIIKGWLHLIICNILSSKLWNEELVGLIRSIIQLLRSMKNRFRDIRIQCVFSLRCLVVNKACSVEHLLKGGAIDVILEEIRQPTLDDKIVNESLLFFMNVSEKLKEEKNDEMEEAKEKELKKKVFEKMEEEGYEDTITSFNRTLSSLKEQYSNGLSLNISDHLLM